MMFLCDIRARLLYFQSAKMNHVSVLHLTRQLLPAVLLSRGQDSLSMINPNYQRSKPFPRRNRFCIPCGVTTKRYHEGVVLNIGRERLASGQVCRQCSKFRVGWMEGEISQEIERLVLFLNGCDCPQGIQRTSSARRFLELCSQPR